MNAASTLATGWSASARKGLRPVFPAEIRIRHATRHRTGKQWRWHLDEVFVKISGRERYLRRGVDCEGALRALRLACISGTAHCFSLFAPRTAIS
ncbi:DDE-type integrase/transposase/recombinase [Paracoccus suum]|uniref:DDE-type integrase/transposase/recombinase n=1 Tax=Paracoccus suum TaxID=2259340 RepID=UPI003BAE3F1F